MSNNENTTNEVEEVELIFSDEPLVVKRPRGRPRKVYTQEEIDDMLEKRRILNTKRNARIRNAKRYEIIDCDELLR